LRRLIHLERNDHFENGDIHLEGLLIIEILHDIGAIHLAQFGAQVTAAYILIAFARLKDGLDSDDAFAFHLPVAAITVEDMPVPAVQLDGEIVMISMVIR